MSARLYAHALVAARPRQLRARLLRPVARRRFPNRLPPRQAVPVPAGEPLWRSPAFAPSGLPEAGTRLAGFHRHYGEDVLGAARRRRAGRARYAWSRVERAEPAPQRRRLAPLRPLDPDRELDCRDQPAAGARIAGPQRKPLAAAAPARGERRGRRARKPRDSECPSARARRRRLRRDPARRPCRRASAARSARTGPCGWRPLRAQPGLSPRRSPRSDRDPDGARAAWLTDPIDRMIRFASALSRPDGAPALFNDGGLDIAPRLDLPKPEPGLAVVSGDRLRRRSHRPAVVGTSTVAPVATLSSRACTRRRPFLPGLVGRCSRRSSIREQPPPRPGSTAIVFARRRRTPRSSLTAQASSYLGAPFERERFRTSVWLRSASGRSRRGSSGGTVSPTSERWSGRRARSSCETGSTGRAGIESRAG